MFKIKCKKAYIIFLIPLILLLPEFFILFIGSMAGKTKQEFFVVIVILFIISLTVAISMVGLFFWIFGKFKKDSYVSVLLLSLFSLVLSVVIFFLLDGFNAIKELDNFK